MYASAIYVVEQTKCQVRQQRINYVSSYTKIVCIQNRINLIDNYRVFLQTINTLRTVA